MTKCRVLAAIAAVAFAVGVPAAHAASQQPVGPACGFASVYDPSTGLTDAVIHGAVVAPGSTVTLRCSIHSGNASHTGVAVASAATAPSQSVAVLAPQASTFWSDGDFAICSEATVDDTTWYLSPDDEWSTDSGVGCPVSY